MSATRALAEIALTSATVTPEGVLAVSEGFARSVGKCSTATVAAVAAAIQTACSSGAFVTFTFSGGAVYVVADKKAVGYFEAALFSGSKPRQAWCADNGRLRSLGTMVKFAKTKKYTRVWEGLAVDAVLRRFAPIGWLPQADFDKQWGGHAKLYEHLYLGPHGSKKNRAAKKCDISLSVPVLRCGDKVGLVIAKKAPITVSHVFAGLSILTLPEALVDRVRIFVPVVVSGTPHMRDMQLAIFKTQLRKLLGTEPRTAIEYLPVDVLDLIGP